MQEWTSSEILLVCRLVRSLNAAAGLQTYNIAIFANSAEEQLSSDFKTQIVFYHDKSVTNNGECYDIIV